MHLNWFTGKTDFRFLGVYLTTVFSGAYLTKLGFSPIYPLMMVGFFLVLMIAVIGRIRLSMKFWSTIVISTAILFYFSVHQTEQGSLFQNALNFMLGPIGFLAITSAGRHLSQDKLKKIVRHFVYLTILITLVECIYRLTHPDYSFLENAQERQIDISEIAFYAYKFNSLMYLDSNFVGLQVAIVFAFVLAVVKFNIRFSRSVYIILFLIICATLSRASVIASLAAVGFYFYPRLSRTLRTASLVLGFLGIQVVFFLVQSDGSFATKIALLEQLSDYFRSAPTIDLILGVGAGRAIDYLGMGAHNLVVVYVVEAGLLLSAIVAMVWAYLFKTAKGSGLIIAVWLINGFSLTSFAMPYMYCAAAILWCLTLCEPRKSSAKELDNQKSPIAII